MIIQISQYLSKIYFQKKNIYVKLNLTHASPPLLSFRINFKRLSPRSIPPPLSKPDENRRMWVTAGAADRKGWPARNNGTASTLSRYALIFIPWFRVVPPPRSVSQFCIGRIGVLASSRYYYARYIIKFPLLWKQELIEEGEEERCSSEHPFRGTLIYYASFYPSPTREWIRKNVGRWSDLMFRIKIFFFLVYRILIK